MTEPPIYKFHMPSKARTREPLSWLLLGILACGALLGPLPFNAMALFVLLFLWNIAFGCDPVVELDAHHMRIKALWNLTFRMQKFDQ